MTLEGRVFRVIVRPRDRASVLVYYGPRWHVRAFLRSQGIRPTRSGFEAELQFPFNRRLHCYRLSGDDHLKIRRLRLPRITWGRLALYAMGQAQWSWTIRQADAPARRGSLA